jgi:hypothetical protein
MPRIAQEKYATLAAFAPCGTKHCSEDGCAPLAGVRSARLLRSAPAARVVGRRTPPRPPLATCAEAAGATGERAFKKIVKGREPSRYRLLCLSCNNAQGNARAHALARVAPSVLAECGLERVLWDARRSRLNRDFEVARIEFEHRRRLSNVVRRTGSQPLPYRQPQFTTHAGPAVEAR